MIVLHLTEADYILIQQGLIGLHQVLEKEIAEHSKVGGEVWRRDVATLYEEQVEKLRVRNTQAYDRRFR